MVYDGDISYIEYEKKLADESEDDQFMGDILPVDLQNEIKAWEMIDHTLKRFQNIYSTTLEEDHELL